MDATGRQHLPPSGRGIPAKIQTCREWILRPQRTSTSCRPYAAAGQSMGAGQASLPQNQQHDHQEKVRAMEHPWRTIGNHAAGRVGLIIVFRFTGRGTQDGLTVMVHSFVSAIRAQCDIRLATIAIGAVGLQEGVQVAEAFPGPQPAAATCPRCRAWVVLGGAAAVTRPRHKARFGTTGAAQQSRRGCGSPGLARRRHGHGPPGPDSKVSGFVAGRVHQRLGLGGFSGARAVECLSGRLRSSRRGRASVLACLRPAATQLRQQGAVPRGRFVEP